VAPQPPPSSDSAEASEVERKRKRDTYYDKHEELEELAAKDELTLMVRQLHPRTAEFDVFELFSSVGKVKDVRLIQDERSGKCVGVGYVEMATRQDLAMALGLDGTVLRGMPMVVQVSFAEKNRLAATGASAAEIKAVGHGSNGSGGGGGSDAGMKLYVGSLHPSLTEDQLRGVFAPFGQLDRVDVHKTPTGESKGYAFLHFALAADGRKCMAQMDGFSLAGAWRRGGRKGWGAGGGWAGLE
jgi:RNA-binding protein 39